MNSFKLVNDTIRFLYLKGHSGILTDFGLEVNGMY